MDQFVSMVCQTCGDRLQQTAYQNRYRCASCHNEYLIDKNGMGLISAAQGGSVSAAPAPSEIGYIASLRAHVSSLKFFTAGYENIPPASAREYLLRFKSDVDYVYWELNLDHPALTPSTLEFVLFTVWNYPDGKTSSQSTNIKLQADWSWSHWWNCTSKRYTDIYGDHWMLGDYRVDFFVEGKRVASNTFTIYD